MDKPPFEEGKTYTEDICSICGATVYRDEDGNMLHPRNDCGMVTTYMELMCLQRRQNAH